MKIQKTLHIVFLLVAFVGLVIYNGWVFVVGAALEVILIIAQISQAKLNAKHKTITSK